MAHKLICSLVFLLFVALVPGHAQSVPEATSDEHSTAQSMAELQADYLQRQLNLTERQRRKVVEMYQRFNDSFMNRRDRQEGSDQSGIREMLQAQANRRDRELKRILTEEQYELYIASQQ